jgi:hypothetical protein
MEGLYAGLEVHPTLMMPQFVGVNFDTRRLAQSLLPAPPPVLKQLYSLHPVRREPYDSAQPPGVILNPPTVAGPGIHEETRRISVMCKLPLQLFPLPPVMVLREQIWESSRPWWMRYTVRPALPKV